MISTSQPLNIIPQIRGKLAVFLIVAVWLVIYVPHIGERELRGEEPRRIVPAQEMIESSQWATPTLAGNHYSNKPPLINWLIAGSFQITGSNSEWAARLPSIFALLALALGTFFVLRREYGNLRATEVAMILLTAISMIEKCRMAEIESVFVALFGFACYSWIALWTSKKSPWLVWTIPYVFIGLACLTKGPVHLPFWICFIIPALKYAKSLRDLFHPAHLVGLLITLLITAPWVAANLSAVQNPDSTVSNWMTEITSRVNISREMAIDWMVRPVKVLILFLPWTLPLLYALWHLRKKEKHAPDTRTAQSPDASDSIRWRAVAHGCFWCVFISFIGMLLLPGGHPRYLLPIYPLAAIAVVVAYSRISSAERNRYERFGNWLLKVLSICVPLIIIGGTVMAIQKERTPSWITLVISFSLLCGFCLWLFRRKTSPGLFLSAAFFTALVFFAGNTMAIPVFKTRYVLREGERKIRNLAQETDGTKVLFADNYIQYQVGETLGLLYYLKEGFVTIGEAQALPEDATFVIGPTQARAEMETLASAHTITKSIDLVIDRVPMTALYLEPRP